MHALSRRQLQLKLINTQTLPPYGVRIPIGSSNERIAELETQLDAERKMRELKDEEFKHLSAKMQIQEQTLASKDEEFKRLSAMVQEQGLQLQAITSFLAYQGMTLPQFHTTNNKSER
ncbi:hypothetical protein L6452_05841 [Arctium lappa]|uniref:Uncharacterized protein n=1 Tax=Arctium lappa TaxID=4217 RepID=A0ACB9EI75_ARCLA|nr:hypothetical protein L6452_05841 [Arctium lappa]